MSWREMQAMAAHLLGEQGPLLALLPCRTSPYAGQNESRPDPNRPRRVACSVPHARRSAPSPSGRDRALGAWEPRAGPVGGKRSSRARDRGWC
jgi:hypothetical protein